DGTLYFDEKHVDGSEYKGPLATTASVVRGVTAFAAVAGKLNYLLEGFFLWYRISIPLILSLPATVLSLTSKDQLKVIKSENKFARLFILLSESLFLCLSQVEVTTVFGSATPPLTVNLVQASSYDKSTPVIENQVMQFSLVFLKLRHESKVEHIFALESSTKQFKIILLLRLGVNFKGFPSSSVPVLFSILFHAGIAAVLLLYGLFWLKVLYRFPS
ncbi:hypothetical protein BHE74_00026082, partial [Ensete ventricosum]